MAHPPTPCLLGPTGSGKSDVAILAAGRRGGEVICCDAFTVYRGMEILTAAPTPPASVPHHLLSERDPARAWSAADFATECDVLVAGIRSRGREPWIVGGSALYLRGWLKGFGAPVPRDQDYRERLAGISAALGVPTLHRLLRERDPARAADVHPNDERRIVRALEIIHKTGHLASELRGEWDGPDRGPAALVGLRRSPEDLDRRILERTRAMFEGGVVEEVRRLVGRKISPEARKALGMWEIESLISGGLTPSLAKESIVRRTRRFARKQMTFFQSFEEVRWIVVGPTESTESVADRVLDALSAPR